MPSRTDPSKFWQAFRESDRELRLRHALVGCVLALVLMPAGSTLDAVVYPELFWSILQVRWLTNVFIAIVLALLLTPFGKRHVRWLGSAWVFGPAMAIAWMIAISQGTASPYYAGLNLVIIIGCLLMPYTLLEAAVVCLIVMGLYLVACVAHPASQIWSASFYNNLYFIALTAIIAIASCHYYHRRRIEDFRLRHELDARNRELAELDRLKSEFFANISHELRTPLTLILGPVDELLQRQAGQAPQMAESLQLVRQNALRLLKMINDLLEVVRLDARRAAPETPTAVLDLASTVPGITETVRHLARDKKLDLRVEGQAEHLPIRGDTSAMEKVFLNLLTNAIKFTPSGGRITVRWRQENQRAVVEVMDTGIGIPQEQLPHIFDRFRQVDGSATRRFRGLGLGLALVKELVEEHQGELDVRSEVGQGTTFVVTLPLVGLGEIDRAETSPTAVPDAPEQTADPLVSGYEAADHVGLVSNDAEGLEDVGAGEHHVLVVDDEPDMRRFLVSILAESYRVAPAADGETGLARALENPPDIIVLDMMLPGMDGLEVCRRMRADSRLDDTRIIMLTARADEQTKLTALQHGADDFLTKPFSSVEVRTRIRNLVRTLSLQRDLRRHNIELQRTLRELSTTRDQLIQSEKMNALGSLAAGLLHEINNPLNYALVALQLMEDDLPADDAQFRDTLTDIGDGMRRIEAIITDLRTFAYPEREKHGTPVSVHDVVQTALRFTSHQAEQAEIDVDVDSDATVWGSHTQLTQVMVNLLTNALRAVQAVADRRDPKITIRTDLDGERCAIAVRDNGTGIEPELLKRIFDPFYTGQDVGKGMGLGLSICHTIITNHGGSMAVQSEPDAWTQVTLDLPTEEPETRNTDEQSEQLQEL